VNGNLLAILDSALGPSAVLRDASSCAMYMEGARYGRGNARAVLLPRTISQALAALTALHSHSAPFVVQGANTGLVAASTTDSSGEQYLLSLDRLKGPVSIDPVERTATVAAGTRLSELNEAAAKHGLCFPIDLGADPTIGGMIATNTGGARLIKYGDVRTNLCSVDVWIPGAGDEPITLGTALRKNNTGIELKHLMCGTAGVLGVVLSATVRLHPVPRQRATALVVPASTASLMNLVVDLEHELPEFVASVEGMSGAAMKAVFRHIPSVRNPFTRGEVPEYAVLIELVTSLAYERVSLAAILEGWLEGMLDRDLVTDALFGDEESFWRIRHSISEAVRAEGKVIALDVSLPRKQLANFREWGRSWLAQNYPAVRIYDFGHVADGGLHFNLVAPKEGPEALTTDEIDTLRSVIFDKVVHDFQGSYSAEHGIGPYNRIFYERYTPKKIRRIASSIKEILMPDSRCGNVSFD
jgi:FAD/FMN-containing dehydrogenase